MGFLSGYKTNLKQSPMAIPFPPPHGPRPPGDEDLLCINLLSFLLHYMSSSSGTTKPMSWSLRLHIPWRGATFTPWLILSRSWGPFSIRPWAGGSFPIWVRSVFLALLLTSLTLMSSFWVVPVFKGTSTLLIGWFWRDWLGAALLS